MWYKIMRAAFIYFDRNTVGWLTANAMIFQKSRRPQKVNFTHTTMAHLTTNVPTEPIGHLTNMHSMNVIFID